MIRKSEKVKRWIDIIQGAVVIISLPIALVSLHNTSIQTKIQADALEASRKVESARFVLEFASDIDGSQYRNVITAIEDGKDGNPQRGTVHILKQSGGKITPRKLDDYLAKLNDIGLFYSEGLIDKDMAYDEFSYDMEKAYCNEDIMDHVMKERNGVTDLNDPKAFYAYFDWLAKEFLSIDHYKCADLDKQ